MSEHQASMLARVAAYPFIALIYAYRATLSPFLGGQCRFEPTCSRYGLDAYRRYGAWRGTLLTAARVLRCHPFSKGGYDPVPFPDEPGAAAGPGDASSPMQEPGTRTGAAHRRTSDAAASGTPAGADGVIDR